MLTDRQLDKFYDKFIEILTLPDEEYNKLMNNIEVQGDKSDRKEEL